MEIAEKPSFMKKLANTSRAVVAATAFTFGNTPVQELQNPSIMVDASSYQAYELPELKYKLYVGGLASSNENYPATEFGFNTHVYANKNTVSPNLLDLDRFKGTVNDLSENNQSWIRFNIPRWEGARLVDGNLAWDESEMKVFDEAVGYAKDKKLQVFLVATPPPVEPTTDKDEYARITHDYFSYMADRYKNSVDVWQINNEIDVHHPADYSYNEFEKRDKEFIEAHVKAASDAIRSKDPRANITVNVTGWPVTDEVQDNWEEFIEPLLPYVNAISLDLYPDGNTAQIESLSDRVEDMRKKYKLPIYVSETGICTVGCYLNGMSQKEILIRILEDLKEAKPKAIILYQYTDEDLNNKVEGSFGVTDVDGNKKKGYEEILSKMQK